MDFSRTADIVAPSLLGATLVRRWPDGSTSTLRIVETEAYRGRDDLASHGRKLTPRSEAMYGPPGRAYIYLSRGLHWMFNVVAEPEGEPAVVLIRAAEPLTGYEALALHRPGRPVADWTSGPGKLCQALAIDDTFHRAELGGGDPRLALLVHDPLPPETISTGPRVGMGKTPEPWFSIARRWWITGNPFVSAYR